MLAPGAPDFLFDERLHAQAYPVNAGGLPRARLLRRDAARRGFQSGFRPTAPGNQIQNRAQRRGIEITWRATAQVHCLRLPFPLVRADLPPERVQVAPLHFSRENARREIAVGTLLRAKRVGDVDSGHVFFILTPGNPTLPRRAPPAGGHPKPAGSRRRPAISPRLRTWPGTL